MTTSPSTTTTLESPLMGARHHPPALALIPLLRGGTELFLEPQPDNPFDPNAVKVLVDPQEVPVQQYDVLKVSLEGYGTTLDDLLAQPRVMLGYIARELAKTFCDALAGAPDHKAVLSFSMEGRPTVTLTILANRE